MNSNFSNQTTLNTYFPTTNNNTGISPNQGNIRANSLATNNFSNNSNSNNSIAPAHAFNRSNSFSMPSNNLKANIDLNPFSTRNTIDNSNKFSSTNINSNNLNSSYVSKNTNWGNTNSKNFY
jgi:hypothetical protein